MAMYNTKIFITCTWQTYLLHNTHNRNRKWTSLIGASLSEPTLAWQHCKTRVYVCLHTWGHIPKFKLNEWKRRYMCISNLHTCWNFCVTKDSLPCNSTLINILSARDRLPLKREERVTAILQRWRQREQEGRRSERTEVRETIGLIDKVCTVRSLSCSVDPSAWS